MRRAFLIGGVIAALCAPPPVLAQNTFKTGSWVGGALFNGQQFTACYVNVNYPDGRRLMIQLTPQLIMYVGATKSDWNMDPTLEYHVSFEIDGGFKKTFQGKVASTQRNAIWFTVGNDADLRRALAGGGTMTWVDTKGARFLFGLEGGDNAMRKLLACAALYGAE